MILDSLKHSSRYLSLHSDFPLVFSFLKREAPQTSGRVELDGDNVFILFSQAHGKKREEAFLEAHRRYVDIHFCFDGIEHIGWRPTQECEKLDKKYDEQRDFMTFSDEPTSWVTLMPGMFAIFFPEVAHASMVSDGVVNKAVAKVNVIR